MKTKLTKEQLMTEYGHGYIQGRTGCSITLICSFGSISCSSDSGDCTKNKVLIETSDGKVIEEVISITCDGKTYDCQ